MASTCIRVFGLIHKVVRNCIPDMELPFNFFFHQGYLYKWATSYNRSMISENKPVQVIQTVDKDYYNITPLVHWYPEFLNGYYPLGFWKRVLKLDPKSRLTITFREPEKIKLQVVKIDHDNDLV